MRLLRSNTVKIGGKSVEVRKITVAQWRELFGAVQSLPQLIIGAMGARPEERVAYVVIALEHSIDELTRVVSILTGLDAEYIEQNAAIDELVEFFVETAKVNNFGALLKNVRGVLSLTKPETEAETVQDAS